MREFSDLIKRKFPLDENLGFYVTPTLPAAKLGKAIANYTKISSPHDVIAFYLWSGLFSSSAVVFTKDMVYYPDGVFKLEDIRAANVSETIVQVQVNQNGATVANNIKTGSPQSAELLAKILDNISSEPKADDLVESKIDTSNFSLESVKWLEIRDEVLRTIDLLYQKFEDGKLSLLEYEEKKGDLLRRL